MINSNLTFKTLTKYRLESMFKVISNFEYTVPQFSLKICLKISGSLSVYHLHVSKDTFCGMFMQMQ